MDVNKIIQDPVDKLTSLVRSLQINIKIQGILADEMAKVESLLAANKKKQVLLMDILERKVLQDELKTSKVAKEFAAPYFQDLKHMVPPPNEDTITKRRNRDVNAFLTPPRTWSPDEQNTLLDGIAEYAHSYALKRLKKECYHIKKKMQRKNIPEEEMERLEDDLYVVEQKIRLINRRPLHEHIKQMNGDIDWLTISATKMQGTRTPEECELMWTNCLSFALNRKAFTQSEDSQLVDFAQDCDERNWDGIAASLKTNRSAIQCFVRYQTKLKRSIEKMYWTKDDDDRLIALINKHKTDNGIPWGKISLHMEGRTLKQIKNRYWKTLSKTCIRGAFCPEEDALLIALHQKYGPCWLKMKSFFRQRSCEQIRERYLNVLVADRKVGPWTLQEDKLLIMLIRKHGYGQWKKISGEIPGRTDHACLLRAKRLLKWSIEYYSDRGKEYDPEVYDPDLFAKILRPLPKSENLRHNKVKYEKLKSFRVDALKTLLEALQIISPEYVAGVQDLNAVDVSWMSSGMLLKLRDVLYRRMPEMKAEPAAARYLTKPPPRQKKAQVEREEDFLFPSQGEKIPAQEMDLVYSAMDKCLDMQTDSVIPPRFRKVQNYGTREWAEMSLYTSYLSEQFHCKAAHDEEEEVVFNKVDYRASLHNVVQHFVQPPVYGQQFIILTPNICTLAGMESVQATEDRLLSMSGCVSHSRPYIDYLCERRKASPHCLQCLHNLGEIDAHTNPQSVISDMKSKSFLLDKRLEEAASIEGASVERLNTRCVCEDLRDSKRRVQLLRKRFLSFFIWPALLSAVGFHKEQESAVREAKSYNVFWDSSPVRVESPDSERNPRKRRRGTAERKQESRKKRKL